MTDAASIALAVIGITSDQGENGPVGGQIIVPVRVGTVKLPLKRRKFE
ncbi:MAG: hypothetical protein IT445_10000 [Phycisphaeraceae bacterium]|nr:hypothetical protein [Phycisphaeraceae bacterium]